MCAYRWVHSRVHGDGVVSVQSKYVWVKCLLLSFKGARDPESKGQRFTSPTSWDPRWTFTERISSTSPPVVRNPR